MHEKYGKSTKKVRNYFRNIKKNGNNNDGLFKKAQ